MATAAHSYGAAQTVADPLRFTAHSSVEHSGIRVRVVEPWPHLSTHPARRSAQLEQLMVLGDHLRRELPADHPMQRMLGLALQRRDVVLVSALLQAAEDAEGRARVRRSK